MRVHPILLVLVVAGLAFAPGAALAKKKTVPRSQYSVPFACGIDAEGVEYDTTIDVHNFGGDVATVVKRLALSEPEGVVSDDVEELLAAGAAHGIGCADILAFVFSQAGDPGAPWPDFGRGFVVIESDAPLVVQVSQRVTSGTDVEVSTSRILPQTVRRSRRDGDAKVEICHVPPGNPANAHEIYVGASSVPAHLGHGDTAGSCDD